MTMKFFPFVVFFFAIWSCNNSGSGKQENVKRNVRQNTEIKVDEEIHDFGILQAGEIVLFTFVLTNTGENNLIIENVESDCGCVHINYTKQPVKPGAAGLVEVEFDTSGLFGREFKTITLHANIKEPKQLAIFAEVKNEDINIQY